MWRVPAVVFAEREFGKLRPPSYFICIVEWSKSWIKVEYTLTFCIDWEL